MESDIHEQLDELEVLKSIYDEDFTEISSQPPCFMIRLRGDDINAINVSLKVTFPECYPMVAPCVEVPIRSGQLSQAQQRDLLSHLSLQAEDNTGMAMVFTLVEAAKEWLSENCDSDVVQDVTEADVVQELTTQVATAPISLPDPTTTGGRWDFCIGLVGKPSAGKSTFFNAATTHESAKMGAHPFTTIEANIGKAYYTIPCPCQQLHTQCDAAHGHSSTGERYVPVILKDVAGLVPGACQGKGRGNRFLNDLLDADVLIHIIDASGCTDEKGEQTTEYDPSLDVVWLQQEIHQWIYDNIREKWDNIRRRPAKLVDMFTGYHASKAIIHAAFHNAGVDEKKLSELPSWSEEVLHSLVKHFLLIRFPIFLVLNKCDTPSASSNISRIEEKFADVESICVSARTECLLQTLEKQGCIRYSYGDSTLQYTSHVPEEFTNQIKQVTDFLKSHNCTNVQKALSGAVRLREPLYVYPVQCLQNLTSIDKYRGEVAGRLRDCVTLKPHTTVEQLYLAMSHYPLHLTAGDFIRAECLEYDECQSKIRIMKKDEKIIDGCNVLRIYTNRKISQIKGKD